MAIEDTVEDLLSYANMLIETAVAQESVTSMGKLCNDISRYYRAIGICGLLLNADTEVYFHALIQSALTRKYYLDRCIKENHLDDPARKSSFVAPLLDAVAANQFSLASQIAALSPDVWQEGYEYEDDFTYAAFLHEFILFNETSRDKLQRILDRWEGVLEGNSDPRFDLCHALFSRNQSQFEEAYYDLLNAHDNRMSEIADPKLDSSLAKEYTFEPNRWIFVEGLAMLRIADKLELRTEREYKLCPSIARLSDYAPFVPRAFPNLALE
jgi:hypothetical protein